MHAARSYNVPMRAPIGNPHRRKHAACVKSGYRMVSIGLLLLVSLRATDAGRAHESGTGAMWIAPELIGSELTGNPLPTRTCGHPTALSSRELIFETLDAEDVDSDLPRLLASGAREVVKFEWNAATGELGFNTQAGTTVFSDLAPSSRASSALNRRCGSH